MLEEWCALPCTLDLLVLPDRHGVETAAYHLGAASALHVTRVGLSVGGVIDGFAAAPALRK